MRRERESGIAITDLVVTGNWDDSMCAPTKFECPLRSESSFACKKLELESSGARSSEKDRLNGNNLSIVLAKFGENGARPSLLFKCYN